VTTTIERRAHVAQIVTTADPYTVLPGRGWFNRPYPDMGADYEAATVKDNRTGYVYRVVCYGPERPTFLACNCGAPMHHGANGDATRCAHVMAYVRSVVRP